MLVVELITHERELKFFWLEVDHSVLCSILPFGVNWGLLSPHRTVSAKAEAFS